MAEWTPQKYVFRMRADKNTERMHFGQWHLNGTATYHVGREKIFSAGHSLGMLARVLHR